MTDSTSTDERTCNTCGVSIEDTYKLRRYCDEHTPDANRSGKRPCPRCGQPSWSKTVECRNCSSIKADGPHLCSKPGRRGTCRNCYRLEKPAETCAACGQERRMLSKGMCATCYSAAYRASSRGTTYENYCAHCGNKYRSRKRGTSFCSRTCDQRSRAGWIHSTELSIYTAGPEPSAAPTSDRRATTWVQGNCALCRTPFTTDRAGSRYCTRACRKKAHAKAHGLNLLDRMAIFARDNWTCQICGEPADWTANPNSDWYPTLDHITPRSHGGNHEPENLRTAHRWCNSVRGDLRYYTDMDLAPSS